MRDERLRVADVLRTLSILLVLAWHVERYTPNAQSRSIGFAMFWSRLASNGHYGVTVFFLLSGFLITRTCVRPSTDPVAVDVRDFYVRRVGRIVPMFAVTVVLGAALAAFAPRGPAHEAMFAGAAPRGCLFWLSLATFSFNWLRVFTPDEFGLHWDVLWSLSIEEQFYLLFPWVVRAAVTRARLATLLAVVVVQGPLARFAFAASGYRFAVFMNSPGAFEMIAMGALVALASDGIEVVLRDRPWAARFLMAYGAALFFVTYVSAPRSDASLVFVPSVLALASACMLVAGAHLPFFRSPLWRLPTLPGQMSYGMYLLHPLVFFLLWPAFEYVDRLAAWIMATAATLVLSRVVFAAFERPANRQLRRWLSPVPPRVSSEAALTRAGLRAQ